MSPHPTVESRPEGAPRGASTGDGGDPVRVLILAPAPVGDDRIGGIATFIRGFVACAPDNFEIEIVGAAIGDEAPEKGWQSIQLAGRSVRFLPVTRMRSARRTGRMPLKARIGLGILRNRRRIKTTGLIVQVHTPAMEFGLLGRGARTIRVVHNAPENLAAAKGGSAWSRLGRLLHGLERVSFRRAEQIFFVDSSTRDEYAASDSAAAGRMHHLSNGVDTDLFRPLAPAERDARRALVAQRYGLAADDKWLIFASRLDQQKDPELLIRGLAAYLAREGPRADLLVAGEGSLRARMIRLATKLDLADRVHFLGVVPHSELARLMPAMDACVMSSAYEAAPFVVYEALASGLPVVSTSVGEVPRIVRHGVTGWITSDRTAEALADGIGWALAQSAAEIGPRCAASMVDCRLCAVLAPFLAAHRGLTARAGPT